MSSAIIVGSNVEKESHSENEIGLGSVGIGAGNKSRKNVRKGKEKKDASVEPAASQLLKYRHKPPPDLPGIYSEGFDLSTEGVMASKVMNKKRITETSGSIAFLCDLLPSPKMPSPRNPSPYRTENFSPARSDSPGLATTAHRRTTISQTSLLHTLGHLIQSQELLECRWITGFPTLPKNFTTARKKTIDHQGCRLSIYKKALLLLQRLMLRHTTVLV